VDAENATAVSDHFGKLVSLQRPLEFAHDGQERAGNCQRR
jgi:hypothetical protein